MAALAVIDLIDGHQRRRHEVSRWPLRIGRALDNDLVLDDVHVAAHHASLDLVDGRLQVQVGDSRNGARLAGRRLARSETAVWNSGDGLHLGKVQLRIRHATGVPEVPLAQAARRGSTGLLALLTLAVLTGQLWLELDGSAPWWRTLLPMLVGSVFLLALWVAGWSLACKLFTRQTEARRHLRVLLAGTLVYVAVGELLALTAYSFDWPTLGRSLSQFEFVAFAGLVVAHLRVISPGRLGLQAAAVGAITFTAAAMLMLVRLNEQGGTADHPHMTGLYPPGWQLASPQTLDGFLVGAATLKTQLDREAADPAEAEREYPD